MRGILNTIIQSLFSELASIEGWPLVRVATYRGTTVCIIGAIDKDWI